MNELKSPLFQTISALSTVLIGITAFFREHTVRILILILLLGLIIYILIRLCKKQCIPEYFLKLKTCNKPEKSPASSDICSVSSCSIPVMPSVEDAPYKAADEKIMMRHISNRISEKLKSAYPEATWQYAPEPALGYILNGGTVRIETENTGTYDHADIQFDKYAKLQIQMLIIGEFASQNTKAVSSKPSTPPIIDVEAWYRLIAQNILDNAVTDANAKGHKKLYIKENGDIITKSGNKQKLIDTLSHFPGKNYWKELQDILTADDLTGSIDKDQFVISWN